MNYKILFSISALAGLVGVSPAPAGHTHYFTWQSPPDPVALQACVADMKRVLDASRGLVAGRDGQGPPFVQEREVIFNGMGEEDAHEPFIFPGKFGFNFCKTMMKPYDATVMACLLTARDHFPMEVLVIEGDGSWPQDWAKGAALYQRVFDRPPRNPTSGGQDVSALAGDGDFLGGLLVKTAVVGGLLVALWLLLRNTGARSRP